MENIVVFDFETTGLYQHTDRIVEIGAVEYDINAKLINTYEKLINPNMFIPSSSFISRATA